MSVSEFTNGCSQAIATIGASTGRNRVLLLSDNEMNQLELGLHARLAEQQMLIEANPDEDCFAAQMLDARTALMVIRRGM
jgi:hypothetical protein